MAEFWHDVTDDLPPKGVRVEILHFGHEPVDEWITDTGVVDRWGSLCPDAADGGHGKRSTVTHWRPMRTRITGAEEPAPRAEEVGDG